MTTITAPAGTAADRDRQQRVAAAECYVRTRFYPPLPYQYGEYAVQAIEAVNGNDEQAEIMLDPTLPVHPASAVFDESGSVHVAAADLVDALRLWHMIEEPCPDCRGTGLDEETIDLGPADGCVIETWDCQTCSGSGMV